MAKTFQVTGPCVTNVPVAGVQGTQLATFYAGHVLPADVPADRIKHLLSVGLIEEVGGGAAKPVDTPVSEGGDAPAAVNARSSKGDLVAFGVAQGGDRAELDGKTVKELQALYLKGDVQS